MGIRSCTICGRGNPSRLEVCWNCGSSFNNVPPNQATEISTYENVEMRDNLHFQKRYVFLGIVIASLIFFSNYHVVMINSVPTPVKRVSISLSEPFTDLTEISVLPWIVAKSKYPLTVLALQEADIVETDYERSERLRQEYSDAMEPVRQAFEERRQEMKERNEELQREVAERREEWERQLANLERLRRGY